MTIGFSVAERAGTGTKARPHRACAPRRACRRTAAHRKTTHIFRATHLSWAAPHLPEGVLKAYAGHSRPRGGATDAYVETRPPFMPAAHREVIQIPSPEEVGATRLDLP